MAKPEQQAKERVVKEKTPVAKTMPSRKKIVVVFVVLNVVDRFDGVVGESGSFRNMSIEHSGGFHPAKRFVELGGDSSENSNKFFEQNFSNKT